MPVGKPGTRSSSSFDLRGDGKKLPQLQTYTKLQVAVLSSRLPSQMRKAGAVTWRQLDSPQQELFG